MKRFFSLHPILAKSLFLLAMAATAGTISQTYLNAKTPAPLYHTQPHTHAVPQVKVVNYAPLVKQVKPAVFNLTITGRTSEMLSQHRPQGALPFGPFGFFQRQVPFDLRPFRRPMPTRASGSGFLINAEGYALTNQHVVRNAKAVTAHLEDGREFSVKVLGQSKLLDLALIKLNANSKDKLPFAYLGQSSQLEVGEPVIAIGNARGLGLTVTSGIVSAKGRMIGSGAYDNYIQTDAAINHGNSGGPLFNLRGEVIGINTAILQGGRGIGFAIPIDMVRQVLPQLRKKGRIQRAQLGVMVQKMTTILAHSFGLPRPQGALISTVTKGSPAQKAGLKVGDVILRVGKTQVKNHHHLPRLIAFRTPGDTISLEIWRNRRKQTISVALTRWKEQSDDDHKDLVPSYDQDNGFDLSSLGIKTGPLSGKLRKQAQIPNNAGVLIQAVRTGSLAEQHGMRAADIILEVNQTPVSSSKQLQQVLASTPKGENVLFRIVRKDAALFLAFPLQ